MTYRLSRRNSLHVELQHLYTGERTGPDDNEGSWAMALVEYSMAPHWFIAVWDEWNYGNFDPANRQHYYGSQIGYSFAGTRITAGYARQRQGIICVGGVCRVVPANNGFSISISTTF
jgi:hypothetical protein